jgi:hypothetical protein
MEDNLHPQLKAAKVQLDVRRKALLMPANFRNEGAF